MGDLPDRPYYLTCVDTYASGGAFTLFFVKYIGSSPYDAPTLMNLLPFIQFGYGLWYIKGGMYGMAQGLQKQAPTGGEIIKILPHIPHLDAEHTLQPEDYATMRERVLLKLERMGLSDLRQHIVCEESWTPIEILFQSRLYLRRCCRPF